MAPLADQIASRRTFAIISHPDAGKTTLSEALLYATGSVRKLGRVDHGDAFLDTNTMERQRGITIFTEPAIITTAGSHPHVA